MTNALTGYTAAKGRRFAFTLSAAFGVLAVVAYLRHRHVTFDVLGSLAVILGASGLAIPSKLEPVERGWMAMAHALSRVTTPIFMGIVYFVVMTPIALVRRAAGGNPMVHKLNSDSYWVKREKADAEVARRRMERQF